MINPKRTLAEQMWNSLKMYITVIMLLLLITFALSSFITFIEIGFTFNIAFLKSIGIRVVPYFTGMIVAIGIPLATVVGLCDLVIFAVRGYVEKQNVLRYLPLEKAELESVGVITSSDFVYAYFAFAVTPYIVPFFEKKAACKIEGHIPGIWNKSDFYYNLNSLSEAYNLNDDEIQALMDASKTNENGEMEKSISEAFSKASPKVQAWADKLLQDKNYKFVKLPITEDNGQWELHYIPKSRIKGDRI